MGHIWFQLLIWTRRQAPLTQGHQHRGRLHIGGSLAVWVLDLAILPSTEGAVWVIILHAHNDRVSPFQPVVYFGDVLELLRLIIAANLTSSTMSWRQSRIRQRWQCRILYIRRNHLSSTRPAPAAAISCSTILWILNSIGNCWRMAETLNLIWIWLRFH